MASEEGTQVADTEDERVLALLQGLSDRLGAVEQEILTDASGKTTRRVKDKPVIPRKGDGRNLQDEVHTLRRRRGDLQRKLPRSKLRFCIQLSVLLLLLLGGYLYLRRQTRPFSISRWREGSEPFPGLHWFDRSTYEQGGGGTGADVSEGVQGGKSDGVSSQRGGEQEALRDADVAVQVGLANTEGAGMDEQQSQLRKKVSDAKSLLGDKLEAGKIALNDASLGNAIQEKVVQLEQEEAQEEGEVTSGAGQDNVQVRRVGR